MPEFPIWGVCCCMYILAYHVNLLISQSDAELSSHKHARSTNLQSQMSDSFT